MALLCFEKSLSAVEVFLCAMHFIFESQFARKHFCFVYFVWGFVSSGTVYCFSHSSNFLSSYDFRGFEIQISFYHSFSVLCHLGIFHRLIHRSAWNPHSHHSHMRTGQTWTDCSLAWVSRVSFQRSSLAGGRFSFPLNT